MNIFCFNDIVRAYRTLCRLLANEGELAAMLWLALTATLSAQTAGIKERVRNPVSKNQSLSVKFADQQGTEA